MMGIQRSETNFQESVLSFHCISPRDKLRYDNKHMHTYEQCESYYKNVEKY